MTLPTRSGFFGDFGGKFVPETLMAPLEELERAYRAARRDRAFGRELDALLKNFVGRPTPLTEARRFGELCGGVRLFLKREDLNHTGAHKINNALGQALLAKRMGKERIIAETGAGQHGVATATACALLGLKCVVYMGEVDMARQELNVFRMRLMGAEVVPVSSGSRTLKDAINEAIRDWVTNVATTHYIIGSVLGPHPYPMIVRDFQAVIGREALAQLRRVTGREPDAAVACVGGGSNAIGLFYEMLRRPAIRLVGVEAGGRGPALGEHAARFEGGALGVLHGTRSMLLQDANGQIAETHSVSAGLDYPSIGPEHAYYQGTGRIEYHSCDDALALEGFHRLSETEGIIPALESAHAIGWLLRNGGSLGKGRLVVVNLSGRGDKDVPQVAAMEAKGAMNRVTKTFARLKKEGRCGLVAYVTCGDPGIDETVEIVLALAEAGADAIELGIPFSDPIADGPVIQAASWRALQRGTTIDDVFEIARRVRARSDVALVAFSYLNPVMRYGVERFAANAAEAGIDSLLVTDLPPESATETRRALKARGLGLVFLLAPTSSDERVKLVDRTTEGFIYYVSTTGVTGARRDLDEGLVARLDAIRGQVSRPLAVGFGISKHEHYLALSGKCQAVVVGSAIVRAIGEGEPSGAAERAASVVRGILGRT